MRLIVGTETNTALIFAQQIQFQLIKHGQSVDIVMGNELENCKEIFGCSFILSTYGQGEMPSSIIKLWMQLMSKNPPSINGTVCIYGVGDSFYNQYNYAAKKLNRRLQQLGINTKLVLGDSQQGYTSTLREFTELLLSQLGKETIREDLSKFVVQLSDKLVIPINYLDYEQLELIVNKRLTSKDHFQSTHHLELKTTTSNVPGDILAIIPQSIPSEVQLVLELTGWDPELSIKLENGIQTVPSYLSGSYSIEYILTHIVDIHALPGPSFFYVLYQAGKDLELERKTEILNRLLALSDFDDMYTLYISKPKRTAVEVLIDFESIVRHVNCKFIFDLFPFHSPRQFSIASCLPNQFDLCIAVVQYKTTMKTDRIGLCTTYLKNTKENDLIWCKLIKNPIRVKAPLLMIATGTGVAIPRAIMHQIGSSLQSIFIFGCRLPNVDDYYKNEFEQLNYIPVYSRIDNMYVQDKYEALNIDLNNFKNIVITGSKNLQDFQTKIKLKGVQYEIY